MNKFYKHLKNAVFSTVILSICFVFCLILHFKFKENALTSAVFVVAVFLISVLTHGYIYGIISSFLSVLAVNFAFIFPYFAFNFTIPENIISASILLLVTMVTCGLTAKVRHQEILKAESEKERMRANLLRAVSHDLRTPLTTIYGSSTAILENYDKFSDEQLKKMLKGISEDSEWLRRMVENLLSITKIDSGNVKIIKTDTVLDELIDSVLNKFSKRYSNQSVNVDIPDEFITIPMDSILIEQVLVNILENAVQHAKGMTELSLKVFRKTEKMIFEVRDNGCGIDKDRLKNIFDGIYTNENSLSDKKKNNAGIGLSVCASIIKAHGGEIYAENLKGSGALFRFILHTSDV